jgi:death-on-curing protein
MNRRFSVEDILRIHFQLIEDFGGSHGVRDEGRLKSLIGAPFQEVFGQQQYPDVFNKAAVYLRNTIADHPFIDGNKRTAITICGIFLARNKVNLTADQKELEDFVVSIAVEHLAIDQITDWLKTHSS